MGGRRPEREREERRQSHPCQGEARERRWNPGLATAAGLFAPMSAAALVRLGGEARGRVALGVAAGAAMSAGAFAGLRRRAAVRSR